MGTLRHLSEAVRNQLQRKQEEAAAKAYFEELSALIKKAVTESVKNKVEPDLGPIVDKLDKMLAAISGIKLPSPDLSAITKRFDSLEKKINKGGDVDLSGLKREIIAIKSDIGGLHKSISSIPNQEFPDIPEPVKKWSFTVERNSEGFISEVKAEAK